MTRPSWCRPASPSRRTRSGCWTCSLPPARSGTAGIGVALSRGLSEDAMIEPKLAAEPMSAGLDPFDYEVFYHRLFSILAESRDLIRQLAFSQISREVGETAEGFYLPGGEVVLLSPGLLLHLNTVSRTIRYMIENRFRD